MTILEDDRPKKAGKAKKKAGMKVSPPPHRKSPTPPPVVQKAKEQPQPIRILKSDGNAGTTMFSPAQVICLMFPTSIFKHSYLVKFNGTFC